MKEQMMTEEPKRLAWGETPFDNLSHKDLLRECQRMFSAVDSLYCALNIARHGETTGYWGYGGTGGKALEKGRQIRDRIHAEYDSEDIYRSFYRYAIDLLFEKNQYEIGFNWVVCDKCETMLGRGNNPRVVVGAICGDALRLENRCDGVLRELTWDDLKPRKDVPESPLT